MIVVVHQDDVALGIGCEVAGPVKACLEQRNVVYEPTRGG